VQLVNVRQRPTLPPITHATDLFALPIVREVNNAVDTLVGLIEPIMIVALAVGVAILLASVLLPIYNITASF
jgi:type II secretory pathway component PulF